MLKLSFSNVHIHISKGLISFEFQHVRCHLNSVPVEKHTQTYTAPSTVSPCSLKHRVTAFESHASEQRLDLEKGAAACCQEWYLQGGWARHYQWAVKLMSVNLVLPPRALLEHPLPSPLLTVGVCLSCDAPEAETASLRWHQHATISQPSVSSSMLQEQKAVDGRHRSGCISTSQEQQFTREETGEQCRYSFSNKNVKTILNKVYLYLRKDLIRILWVLLLKMKNKDRVQEEHAMCPVLKLLQRFSIQTPFVVHFSPFLCGSLQMEHRPLCLTPPDNEPSITTGCGNYPQGRALTDSRDVSCMAAAGLPQHVSPHIHILQRGTTTGVNMVCPCNKNGKHLHGSVVTLCKP